MISGYQLLKFVHIDAVFAFLFIHGLSGGTSLLLKRHADFAARRVLLETSYRAIEYSTPTLFIVILTGVALGFYGSWWGQWWIWAALVVVVGASVVMSYFSFRFEGARKAAGLRYRIPRSAKRQAAIAPDADSLSLRIPRLRSGELALGGTLALAVILWLMVYKPF